MEDAGRRGEEEEQQEQEEQEEEQEQEEKYHAIPRGRGVQDYCMSYLKPLQIAEISGQPNFGRQ
eukprot:766357-Hanusia_phi.AAC.1